MSGPVTLGSLRACGETLTYRCILCGWQNTERCIDLPQADDFPFPKLEYEFSCGACGRRNGEPGYHHLILWTGEIIHPPPLAAARPNG